MVRIDRKFVIFAKAVDKKGFELDTQFCFEADSMESPLEVWHLANKWLLKMDQAGHEVNVDVFNPNQPPF